MNFNFTVCLYVGHTKDTSGDKPHENKALAGTLSDRNILSPPEATTGYTVDFLW